MTPTEEDRVWWRDVAGRALPVAAWTPALFRLALEKIGTSPARGVDGAGIETISGQLLKLQQSCLDGSYRPARLLRFTLRKQRPDGTWKEREIGIPTVADQVVMAALRLLLEPVLELRLHPHVWGFRPGRDRFAAVATLGEDCRWQTLVRCDVEAMFPSIDHPALRSAIRQVWPDRLVDWLVDRWLAAWTAGAGIPMGTSISPLLSNACLHVGVDRWLAAQHSPELQSHPSVLAAPWPMRPMDPRPAYGPNRLVPRVPRGVDPRHCHSAAWGVKESALCATVRYADDFALLCNDNGRSTLLGLQRALSECGLALSPPKTQIHHKGCRSDWPAIVLGISLRPSRDGRLHVLTDS